MKKFIALQGFALLSIPVLAEQISDEMAGCKRLIPGFPGYLQQRIPSPFEPLKRPGRTLSSWKEEIVRMFRFSRSNGITGGVHRKMKLIQRRAYGFRNFENDWLRVKALCG